MTMLHEQLDAAHAWSLFTPDPVFVYNPQHDAHLVYWNGVSMTKRYTMLTVMSCLNMYSAESMKREAWNDYIRIYRIGGFGHHNWDNFLELLNHGSMVNYYAKQLTKQDGTFLSQIVTKYSPQELLRWFDPQNERILKVKHNV